MAKTSEITNTTSDFTWFLSGIGEYLFSKEADKFAHLLRIVPKGRILQLAGPPLINSFSKYNYVLYDNKLNFSTLGYNICGDFNMLSLVSDSFEVIVSYHVHEVFYDMRSLLEECYRVLKNEGLFVMFGFNPNSLWGVQRLLGFKKIVPWCNKFYGANVMIKSTIDCEFTLISKESGCYCLYSESPFIFNNLHVKIANFGAFYMLVFKKRSSTGTLNTEKNNFFHAVPSAVV